MEDEAVRVFTDERWAAEVFAGYEVPGWLILRLRRHAVGLDALTAQELAEFGVRVRDVASAVQQVTGAVRTYVLVFGEAHPHFHALVVPRLDSTPEHRRSAQILTLRSEMTDRAGSLAIIPQLRVAYAQATTRHEPAEARS